MTQVQQEQKPIATKNQQVAQKSVTGKVQPVEEGNKDWLKWLIIALIVIGVGIGIYFLLRG